MPITIPEKHYVGLRRQGIGESELPLGFATPLGNDQAYEKRKATVDTWSCGYRYSRDGAEPIPARILDNVLLDGFKIADIVRRHGWNGGNVVWRIEDPRGFELEISSANMASIMDCSTIINGTIQGKCLWGREGSANVLLPEGSEPYQQAILDTKIKNADPISPSDLKFGDVVMLSNTNKAIYFGSFNAIRATSAGTSSEHFGKDDIKFGVQKRHLMYVFDDASTDHFNVDLFNSERYGDNHRVGSWKFVDRIKVAMVVDSAAVTGDVTELVTKLLQNVAFRHEVIHEYSIVTLTTEAIDKKSIRPMLLPMRDQSLFTELESRKLSYYESYGSLPLVTFVPKGGQGILVSARMLVHHDDSNYLTSVRSNLASLRKENFSKCDQANAGEIMLSSIPSGSLYSVQEEMYRRIGRSFSRLYATYANPYDILAQSLKQHTGTWYTLHIAYNNTIVPFTG